jgi:hypothetical protein
MGDEVSLPSTPPLGWPANVKWPGETDDEWRARYYAWRAAHPVLAANTIDPFAAPASSPVSAPAPRYAVGDTVKHTDKYGATAVGVVVQVSSIPPFNYELDFGLVCPEHELCLVQPVGQAPAHTYKVGDIVRMTNPNPATSSVAAWVESECAPGVYTVRFGPARHDYFNCFPHELELVESLNGAEVSDLLSRMQACGVTSPAAMTAGPPMSMPPAPVQFKVGDRVAWESELVGGRCEGTIDELWVSPHQHIVAVDPGPGQQVCQRWRVSVERLQLIAIPPRPPGPCPDCKGRGTYEGAGVWAWGLPGAAGPCQTCNGKGRV